MLGRRIQEGSRGAGSSWLANQFIAAGSSVVIPEPSIRWLSPRPWMRLFVRSFKIRRAHVRVDLCRDEALVAEEFLYAADIGASV